MLDEGPEPAAAETVVVTDWGSPVTHERDNRHRHAVSISSSRTSIGAMTKRIGCHLISVIGKKADRDVDDILALPQARHLCYGHPPCKISCAVRLDGPQLSTGDGCFKDESLGTKRTMTMCACNGEMVLSDHPAHCHLVAGLFEHLPRDRRGDGLAEIDTTTWHRPPRLTPGTAVEPGQQDQPVLAGQQPIGGQPGVVLREMHRPTLQEGD